MTKCMCYVPNIEFRIVPCTMSYNSLNPHRTSPIYAEIFFA